MQIVLRRRGMAVLGGWLAGHQSQQMRSCWEFSDGRQGPSCFPPSAETKEELSNRSAR